jgi:large subunit ribosomal protein L24
MSYRHLAVQNRGRLPQQQYGRYFWHHRFYMRSQLDRKKNGRNTSAIPVDRNGLRQPQVDEKFRFGKFVDQSMNFTDKENLDEVEVMRGPTERDYYQDHTYHNEWILRDMDPRQRKILTERYQWMLPGFVVEPWVWFPGDQVEVVRGDFSGQRGTVLNVVKYKNEAYVQNVNVKPIVIPASETRPEQTIQREHSVDVRNLRLVDPSTNEPCDVRLVTVRDKETGEKVQRRMSLSTGTLLPVPKDEQTVDVGDPMHDTPLEDAKEPTYFEDKEMPIIVARKLRAMEDHFVHDLKTLNGVHAEYRKENVEYLRRYQQEVVRQAAGFVMEALIPTSSPFSAAAAAGGAAPEGESEDLDEVALENLAINGVAEGTSSSDNSRNSAVLELASSAHWKEAAEGIELPEFTASDIEDLHGRLDLDNPRHRYAA